MDISNTPLAANLFHMVMDSFSPKELWEYLKKEHAGFLQENPFNIIPQEGKLAKEFLFKYPEIYLQINNTGTNYNKFSSQKALSNMLTMSDGEILIIRIHNISVKQTILLNKITYENKSGNFNRLHQIKKEVEKLYQRLDEGERCDPLYVPTGLDTAE